MRTDADIETFINDLDGDEVAILVDLINDLDPLKMVGDHPKFNAGEINVIQRFQQFVIDHPDEDVNVDQDGLEAEVGENPDEDGDIPDTGEDDDDVSDLVAHDVKAGFPGMTEVPAGNGGPQAADETVHRI